MGRRDDTARRNDIASALAAVRTRLDAACRDAGRDPAEVVLLPVTKFFPASDVRTLYDLGCREFGESREPEASTKIAEFRADSGVVDVVRWHMIGRLQRNKVRSVVRWADTVHSVDSVRLADTLDAAVGVARDDGTRSGPLEVLLQVSLDTDPARGGVAVEEVDALAAHVAASPNLALRGLMSVPPVDSDPDQAFAWLAVVHAGVLRDHPAATVLSAGMTGDLEAAIRHGSTCVRVGTAILGQRPIISA
ncbi:YggS family pyridoxal phosphate-dependent enzyme [Rhodococcus spongiicola]|uniref:Pyridoxal phosphate homeostasis protein n=1 Tax=Rhodococcus spongiicola TaxID=2487352 RepID=A0A438AP37_9NOCA|nr:YggS family pyridoxal phosphate-dependent enzyme [Rhodococcus spongiicola]RVW00362.1 YggS family pyridoxal phosphate-dependent enzyme [Rhodococcus spongiicola]